MYTPRTNDYVKWRHYAHTRFGDEPLQGWVYHIDPHGEYLTLEIMVRKKSEQSYKDCNIHRNERCLVLCFPENWSELEYVKSR